MLNKKFVFVIVSLLLLNILTLSLVKSQQPPGLPSELQQDPEELKESIKNKTETKWQYLGKEWQNILLNNTAVYETNSFLEKVDDKTLLFTILFGRPYSLSITLLVIILLWILFFIQFGRILKTYSLFSGSISWIISFGLVMIMAQLGILLKITELLGWLIFVKKGTVWNIAITLAIMLGFYLFYYFGSLYSKIMEQQKEEFEKEREKIERQILHQTVTALTENFKQKGRSWWIIIIILILLAIAFVAFFL